ncbi:MAG: 50S ribosomal protein L21 [Patescibacteria group bacterium]
MYAVIKTGGKQYLVKEKTRLSVEKLIANEGEILTLTQVLMLADETGKTVTVGKPTVSGATVTAKVLKQGKLPKVTVIKYKAKVRYRRKRGHRQPFTELEITKISAK